MTFPFDSAGASMSSAWPQDYDSGPPVRFNDLPSEILVRIFSYLHPIEDQLPLLSMVCRKWQLVLRNTGTLWRSIHVDPTSFQHWHFSLLCTIFRYYGFHIQTLTWRDNSPVYESVFSHISRLSGLKCLHLPVLWTRAVVESLAPLRQLEEVQINGGYSLQDSDLVAIAKHFPRLREISLNACWMITCDGVSKLLDSLQHLESVKLKINSGLQLNDVRSERSMLEGFRIIQWLAESRYSKLITVLCLHFVPIEMDELWHIINSFTRLRKLSISNCEHLHGIRLVSESIQKIYLFNLWSVLFVSITCSNLRTVTIDQGLESAEHLELDSPRLKRVSVDGSSVLRTLTVKSEKLAVLEIYNCDEIDMRSFRHTLKINPTLVSLRLGCISQDSLTLDEFIVPAVQELCLLGDFSCETLHIRSPSLRLLHTEAENDIITLNHVYITANHLCKVALVGVPALKTMTVQCVSVDSIELNLCSDDQLILESCVIHAMTSIGFLRLFDCRVNLLSVSTPLARTVVLYRCQMSDYVLQMALTGCPNISHLNLEKCRDLCNVSIQALPLKYLNMFGCKDMHRLDLNCPELLALNIGHCPNVRLFIQGMEHDLTELCEHPQIVLPNHPIRWSHDYPPEMYVSNG